MVYMIVKLRMKVSGVSAQCKGFASEKLFRLLYIVFQLNVQHYCGWSKFGKEAVGLGTILAGTDNCRFFGCSLTGKYV